MKKLTFTLLLALMAIFSAQAAKVYLKIGEGRVTAESNLAVWAWDDSNKFCTNGWPGDKLTEKETIEGADYFVYTVNTEGSYNIIFNNNEKENTNRTANILGLAGDCTFVLNNEWDGENWSYTKTEGAPGAVTPEPVETYTVQLRGAKYSWGTDAPAFTYNKETGEYVYEETETAKLAGDFKITIVDTNTWLHNDEFKGTLNNEWGFKDLYSGGSSANNMKITDAADYDKITLTVKKEGETWKLKIVGEKKETPVVPVETYTVELRGAKYSWGTGAPAFTYNAETKEYVYEETETAKLAGDFKITIVDTNTWLHNDEFKGTLNNEWGFKDLYSGGSSANNMKITDAADYDKITLTVKKEGETWKLKIVGVKTDKVQITGEFNGWSQVDMVSNPNGTYTYEVEENMAALSEGFCILINGVHYAGNIALDLDGDAVDLKDNPVPGNNLTLIAEGDVASVILTVAKVGDKWTVKAATGKTSSVAGVDAAGVVIAAANGEIVVEGAQSVAVYTTAGALVSTDARTRVAAGLYIVRADNVVKKVIVK